MTARPKDFRGRRRCRFVRAAPRQSRIVADSTAVAARLSRPRGVDHLFQGQKVNLSHVFAGQNVGVTQVGERIWLVTFMQYDLGYFDDETCRLEPIKRIGLSVH